MLLPMSRNNYTLVTLTKEELLKIFLNYATTDAYGNKQLGRTELKQAFEYLDKLMPSNKADAALQSLDRNHDQVISENEITALVEYASRFVYA